MEGIENIIDVRPNIPKLAINDEAPWTPQLTPIASVRIRTVFSSKKKLIILIVVILIVIIVGVIAGNLISNAVSSSSEGKTKTYLMSKSKTIIY